MINEPFEPVSEPRACGWPYHGIALQKRVGGVFQYLWSVNGVEGDYPGDFIDQPRDANVSHKVRHPDAKPLDLTPEEIDSEKAAGRAWYDFATVSGTTSLFYGKPLGWMAWIAILDDNKAWKVEFVPEYVPVGNRYRWIMRYSRSGIGPVNGLTGYTPLQVFWMEVTEAPATILLSAYTAQRVLVDDISTHLITDTALHGDRVLLSGLPVRVITAAEMAAHGVDFATASGELPFQFNPRIWDGVYTVYDGPYDTGGTESPIWGFRHSITTDTLETMPFEGEYPWLVRPSQYISPSSIERVYSSEITTPLSYIDYSLFDVSPRTETHTWEAWVNAHLPEDGSDGYVKYKVTTVLTTTQVYTGRMCGFVAQSHPTGSNVPNSTTCPPPDTATVTVNYEIKQTIEYGGYRYTGTRTGSVRQYNNQAGAPGQGYCGNYTEAGVLVIPTAPTECVRTANAFPPNFQPALWHSLSNYDVLNVPVRPAMPEDYGSAPTDAIWNRQYWSMRTPVAAEDYILNGPGTNWPPVVAKYAHALADYAGTMPAAANMPNGLYYKGRHITSWLPAYNDVWTMDPKTFEIIKFPRAPTYSSDGYLHAIAI